MLLCAIAILLCLAAVAFGAPPVVDPPWNLLVVYSDGKIVTSEFKTEHICREALSIAQYGATIEQKIIDDKVAADRVKAANEARNKLIADFRITHPCSIKVEDMWSTKDQKVTKQNILHCSLPDTVGEQLYDESGKFISETQNLSGTYLGAVMSGSYSYIQKYACFQ